jgi:2-polyprenyl-3-methyl-5-hydroxy-6-metoxy-1,4-benzoquinol methylase
VKRRVGQELDKDEFTQQDIAFHRATAETYDADTTSGFSVYHRKIVEPFLDVVAARSPRGRALDLGCGTGVLSFALARRGFTVLGIDHSEEMLAVAERKRTGQKFAGSVQFVKGDARHVPADDEEFDCITCQGLLHHLPEMESCLSELARLLRPDGHFFISEPSSRRSPLSVGLSSLGRVARLGRRPRFPGGAESVEAPIAPDELVALLNDLELEYDIRFMMHLGRLRRVLPDGAYLSIARVLSFPWRTSRGDLIFIFGRKPASAVSNA